MLRHCNMYTNCNDRFNAVSALCVQPSSAWPMEELTHCSQPCMHLHSQPSRLVSHPKSLLRHPPLFCRTKPSFRQDTGLESAIFPMPQQAALLRVFCCLQEGITTTYQRRYEKRTRLCYASITNRSFILARTSTCYCCSPAHCKTLFSLSLQYWSFEHILEKSPVQMVQHPPFGVGSSLRIL